MTFWTGYLLKILTFCCMMLCISVAYAITWCPSVHPSVTFMNSVKTNKCIFKIFSPLASHTILVFPYQTLWQYSNWNATNGGVESRWGRYKLRLSTNSWLVAIDQWLLKCEQQLRPSTVQFTTQTATHQRICLSQPAWMTMTKRTEFICTQR